MVFKLLLCCWCSAAWLQPAERSTRQRGCSPHAQPCLQCSELGHSCGPLGALYITLGMPAICCAEKRSLACLLTFIHLFYFILFFSFSLSEGLHHLPVFHSLGSRGKEWNKSTCCFYQINLVMWPGQKNFIFPLSKPSVKNVSSPFSSQGFFLKAFQITLSGRVIKEEAVFNSFQDLELLVSKLRVSNSLHEVI